MKNIHIYFWKTIIMIHKPFTDHIGMTILIFAILCGFLAACIREGLGRRKKRFSFAGFSIFPLLSEYGMLRDVKEIHPRIHLMLDTVSHVIASSDHFRKDFMSETGIHSYGKLKEYLFTMKPSDLSAWKGKEAGMAYEKLGIVFYKTRYLFGYLDGKINGGYLLFLLFFGSLYLCLALKKRKKMDGILMTGILLSLMIFGRNGMVLLLPLMWIFYLLYQKLVFSKIIHIGSRRKRKGGGAKWKHLWKKRIESLSGFLQKTS